MNAILQRTRFITAIAIALAWSVPAPSQGQSMGHPAVATGHATANYDLAARFAPYKIREMVHSTTVAPRWIEGAEKFWYEWENSEGKFFYIVDASRGTKRPIFDNDRMAAELTRITMDPYDGQHLPIQSIRFIDENTIQFDVTSSQDEEADEEDEVEEEEQEQEEEGGSRGRQQTKKKVHHFEFDVNTQTLRELDDYEAPDNHPSWASVSPDGQTVLFAKEHNLYMMSGTDYQRILDARRGETGEDADSAEAKVEDIEEIQLTQDGEKYYGYEAGGSGRGETNVSAEKNKADRKRVSVSWSKDSSRFSMIRSDGRGVGLLWVVHAVGNERPELETYTYDMPGDSIVTQQEIVIFDVASRSQVTVNDDPWKDQSMGIVNDRQFFYQDSREPRRSLWISDNADELWFTRISRDRHRADVMVADAATGEILRTVVEDRMNTYQETRNVELLDNGDFLWWSERDGWAHLYLYGPDGTVKRQLTSGPWHVNGVVGVDEARGLVFFTANAREDGEDPYYAHLYRIGLDGSGLTLLNSGDYDHRSSMSPSNRFFVENFSRVNTVPTSALHTSSGAKVLDLEVADFSALMAAGYQFPEPYQFKAADGVTDIYGVMYKPFDFDPEKTYPIVEYVYPGPQTEAVSKFWSTNQYEVGLAQFGMIVVTMGNRGGHPARSKWYHNYGYGNLRDYGLADKKEAIEQLSDRFDYIDRSRVGIYGHSGGGFMSTAAMLVYPDIFDVAVSSSGNHNNDVYNRWWSETHHGVKEIVSDSGEVSFEYDIKKNSDLAANLQGHLMLTTGDIDNNVHHAGTHRMAEALIKANKRFDFFVFPGQRHGYGNMGDYWFWLRAEYFVRHLIGDYRWNADIVPLQAEQPKIR